MNLLFIIPEYLPDRGGIATYYQNLFDSIPEKHQVKILIGSAFSVGGEEKKRKNLTIEYLDKERFEKYVRLFSKFDIFPQLQKHLASSWAMYEQSKRGEGFDVVETTDWGLNYIPWVIDQNSIPVVVTLHGSLGQIDYFDPVKGEVLQSDLTRMIEIITLPLANELHSHSLSNNKFWDNMLDKKSTYIPAPFITTQNEINTEFTEPPLVVGRIQYWKGPTVLCEALKLLRGKASEINWIGRDTIYGKSTESMNKYLEYSYPEIWNKKIKTLGSKSQEEVSKYQIKSRFGIVPSVWDMFNIACIEFMAAGKPVICSESAGVSGLIENGVNGFTYRDNDPQKLAELIIKLNKMTNDELRIIGSKARETVETELKPESVVSKKFESYRNLTSKENKNVKINEWFQRLLNPDYGEDDFNAFLDHHPLRKLIKHSFDRLRDKI